MSNLPGDLSSDPSGETLPVDVSITGTHLFAHATTEKSMTISQARRVEDPPIKEKLQSLSVTADTSEKTEDGSDDDEDEVDDDRTYVGGIKLRDLSGNEVEQFPGIKREKWWSVQ